MADQEQLDILKQGVEIWNQWRREHPSMVPNLSFADLTEVDLDDADLRHAVMFGCRGSHALESSPRPASYAAPKKTGTTLILVPSN
jgi:hypothetical protein